MGISAVCWNITFITPTKLNSNVRTRDVPARHGWLWIKQGFDLFRKSPMMWGIVLGVWCLSYIVLKLLFQNWGEIAFGLIYPGLSAGLMLGCQALEAGQKLQVNHLTEGFRRNPKELLFLGLITLVAGSLIGLCVSLIFPGDVEKLRVLEDPDADIRPILPWLLKLMSIQILASIPILMAMWFAPALLVFHKMRAAHAIRWSLYACISNIGPFIVYGVISVALFGIGLIPKGLGLVVVIPILMASTYSSYRDIFAD